jgi:hypothetical protein
VLRPDGNGRCLLMASVLDDDPNILLLGELNRGLHIVRSSHIDHIASVVAQIAGLRLHSEGYARVVLEILIENLGRVVDSKVSLDSRSLLLPIQYKRLTDTDQSGPNTPAHPHTLLGQISQLGHYGIHLTTEWRQSSALEVWS